MSRTIPLTRGYVAIVDDEDYPHLITWNWLANFSGSGVRAMRSVTFANPAKTSGYTSIPVYMHRQIVGLPVGDKRVVDHRNGNQLDNRKENLRVVSQRENAQNRCKQSNNKSGVTGVSFDRDRNKWTARLKVNRSYLYLGRFEHFNDAVTARRKAEDEHFGEFSYRASRGLLE